MPGQPRKQSERRAKAQSENAKKPRIALPDALRQAATERKASALEMLTGTGLDHIKALIEKGPGAIEYDEKGNASEGCVEQFKRFSWACDYIGDRCGLSKRHETAIEAEGLPPIEVRFQNFPRPADS